MPESGVDAKVVYQLLHDELELGELFAALKGWDRQLIDFPRREPEHEPCFVGCISGIPICSDLVLALFTLGYRMSAPS